MSDDSRDEDTGYGNPPRATRFKKGQSGNPKGRPRGGRNFASDVDDVLGTKMTVQENGRPRQVTAQQAALLRLREKALKGDVRALDRLLTLADQRSAEREAQSKERSLTSDEDDILQRFLISHGVPVGGAGQDDGE